MNFKNRLLKCVYFASFTSAGVVVKPDPNGLTGFLATFTYLPSPGQSVANVSLGNSLLFTDPLHTTSELSSWHLPWEWQPGYINSVDYLSGPTTNIPSLGLEWNETKEEWSISFPLPSGTFQYQFFVNCADSESHCAGQIDAENPPIQARPGEQLSSIVQIPSTSQNQGPDLSFQEPLPSPDQRGTVRFFNYSSPKATHPAADKHTVGVYLPAGYRNDSTYPVAYFHHGLGGNHADWFHQGRLHNILDRLIAADILPPVVVITPSFTDLGFDVWDYVSLTTDYQNSGYDQEGFYAFDTVVSENYFQYLMPWVEDTFAVSKDPSQRAFVGLSMGGGLATEILVNDTDYFDSFGFLSQVPYLPSVREDKVEAFQQKTMFLGAGMYDFALPSTLNARKKLAENGVRQLQGHISSCGGHGWCVWRELAYVYLKDVWEVRG